MDLGGVMRQKCWVWKSWTISTWFSLHQDSILQRNNEFSISSSHFIFSSAFTLFLQPFVSYFVDCCQLTAFILRFPLLLSSSERYLWYKTLTPSAFTLSSQLLSSSSLSFHPLTLSNYPHYVEPVFASPRFLS